MPGPTRLLAGRLILMMLLAVTVPVAAESAETPIVRIEVFPDSLTLGESATLRVTVLVPTWQPVPPVFPGFEVPNAIVRLPPDSARPTSERIGRDTWSGIVRNYQITPLIPARFILGGESIRITWANPGSANRTGDIPVPEAALSATIPAGAAGIQPYLAGRQFDFERTLKGDPRTLEVGDAIVIQYRATLDGMPAVFIPPLAPTLASDLVTAYPEEPLISDGERSERLEIVTVVLNHGGELVLPGRTLQWWNRSENRVAQVGIEPMTLTIEGPPPTVVTEQMKNSTPWLWLAAATAALLAAVGLWGWLSGYRERRQEARLAYRSSEAFAFERLTRADDPKQIYHASVAWVQRLNPALDLRSFASAYGDEHLPSAVDQLAQALYGSGTSTPDIRTLAGGLKTARQRYMTRTGTGSQRALAPLNP